MQFSRQKQFTWTIFQVRPPITIIDFFDNIINKIVTVFANNSAGKNTNAAHCNNIITSHTEHVFKIR